jgi:hypothetical protein
VTSRSTTLLQSLIGTYIHRSLLRLVPFVAIVLLLEEVIPLIVLYAPGMLPSTCILASQRERIDAKRREEQRAFAETMRDIFSDVFKAGPTALASRLPSTVSGIALCGQVLFVFFLTKRHINALLYTAFCLSQPGVPISDGGRRSNDI